MGHNQPEQKTREDISLENCDKEPIHIPGNIQSFAVLIATDEDLGIITHCSANAESVFGQNPKDILGQELSALLGREVIHTLNNVLSLSTVKTQRERVTAHKYGGDTYEIWAHIYNNKPILEFEKVQAEELGKSEAMMLIRSLLGRLSGTGTIQGALNHGVLGLRALSGFDRVLLYKFDRNGDGEIKAEARGPELESFLGLRFPKWDIPKQARELLLKAPLRTIADIHSKPVPLLSHNASEPPLDMSLAASRGQSPIHNDYLKNMGVASTMTLSIVVKGELWGMFAFHHGSTRHIGPSLRGATELFAQFFSLQMEQRIQTDRNAARSKALEHQSVFMEATDTASNISELIEEIAAPFCEIVDADGLALIMSEDVILHGDTPDQDTIIAIAEKLLPELTQPIVTTTSISDYGLDALPIAGALAMTIEEEERYKLIFFRKEASLSVRWAGAPEKDIIEGEDGPRLMPRSSFKAYIQQMQGKSHPWESHSLIAAEEIRKTVVKADAALARRLSHKVEQQRSIYIAELNHRVRNILSLIRSLSRRAKDTSHSLESYAKALEQRICALGAAHDIAVYHIAEGVGINLIFETEIKPYQNNEENRLVITGEKHALKAGIAPTFALVAHELMTNSVKYGALSTSDGSIHIDIRTKKSGLNIIWEERGGPDVLPATRRGFGLGLIETAIPYEMDGDTTIEFLKEGLKVNLWLPGKFAVPLSDAFSAKTKNNDKLNLKNAAVPPYVLVVEDSMMIAIDMAEMLRSLGAQDVKTCATVTQAKRSLETRLPDFAILDINLRDEMSFEVADYLMQHQIPFCFATGYGSDYPVPDSLSEFIILTKPVDLDTLSSTLNTVYGDPKA